MVGRVRRAHGIKGELVVESLTDEPDAVFAPGRRVFAGTKSGAVSPGAPELHILAATPFKDGWILKVGGVDDKTAADTWRERCLLLPSDEVQPPGEGEIFIHALVGMRVDHVNGETVGEVAAVWEYPQGLMLDVRRPGKKNALLPFNDETVAGVDEEGRIVRVDPLEGLLD